MVTQPICGHSLRRWGLDVYKVTFCHLYVYFVLNKDPICSANHALRPLLLWEPWTWLLRVLLQVGIISSLRIIAQLGNETIGCTLHHSLVSRRRAQRHSEGRGTETTASFHSAAQSAPRHEIDQFIYDCV